MANYADYAEGTLINQLDTSTTTGVTVKLDTVNLNPVTWETGVHTITIEQVRRNSKRVEKMIVASGSSQSNGILTLGTLTRGISLSDGSDTTGDSSRKQQFDSGARVFISWNTSDAENAARKDEANTFNSKQTFSTIDFTTDGDEYVKLPVLTEAQRDALTASNGMMVYVTDGSNANRIHTYEGGAWGVSSSSTIGDGSTTASGKFEEATVAEQGIAAATGGTGSRLVLAAANLVKSSSGSGDENKIPVLGSSGTFDINFLATGTADGTKFVRDDGVLTAITSENTVIDTITADTTKISTTTETEVFSSTVSANSLAAGDVIKLDFALNAEIDSSRIATIRVKVDGTTIGTFTTSTTSANAAKDILGNVIFTIRSIGASGGVFAQGQADIINDSNANVADFVGTGTVDTTADFNITMTMQSNIGGAASEMYLRSGFITKYDI